MAKEYKKKINSPKAMEDAWEQYKEKCDSDKVVKTEFSQKLGEFVTAVIPAPTTYNLKGFCNFIGMTKQNFYATYEKKEKFDSVIARMKQECEDDARKKFENKTLPSQLAGLWMSNFGYSTKTESKEEVSNRVVLVDDVPEDW